jgi:hypothetical protein
VEYASVPDGGTLVVPGLGPIGDFACRIGQHRGYRVIGVDLVPERSARVAARGVEVVDLREHEDGVGDVIRDMTDGRGPDSVLAAVGMEAHGSPATGFVQKAAGLLPRAVAAPVMKEAGVDRLNALYSAIDIVRRGGSPLQELGPAGPGTREGRTGTAVVRPGGSSAGDPVGQLLGLRQGQAGFGVAQGLDRPHAARRADGAEHAARPVLVRVCRRGRRRVAAGTGLPRPVPAGQRPQHGGEPPLLDDRAHGQQQGQAGQHGGQPADQSCHGRILARPARRGQQSRGRGQPRPASTCA